MTASGAQQRAGRGRRIIERPRLIKLLDESEARTVLLLAPAGYGKTTLARQWAQKFGRTIVLTLTPAHRDVTVFATQLAALGHLAGESEQYVRSYVSARNNPQRAPVEIGRVVGTQLAGAKIQWIVLDDYQEIAESPEAEAFVQSVHLHSSCRFLIASRLRPRWASPRLVVYGDLTEISRDALAMDESESRLVLGRRADLIDLIRRAQGWPAAIGLAASSALKGAAEWTLPTTLHAFMTQEIYRTAPEELRDQLLRLALAVDLRPSTLAQLFGDKAQEIVASAVERGFLNASGEEIELHPLFRDFLLERLAATENAEELVSHAIEAAAAAQQWERAFHLILRFRRTDYIERVLEQAYSDLVRSGRIGTLAAFVADLRRSTSIPLPPVTDLAEAEVAVRDGSFPLALRIADGVRQRLPESHPLISRANAIIGQSEFVAARVVQSEAAYRRAFETAQDPDDTSEGLRAWALTAVQGENPHAPEIVERLSERRYESPLDLIRCAIVEMQWKRHKDGFPMRPPEIDEGLRVIADVHDPRATSSFAYTSAAALALRADYRPARELMAVLDAEIERYDLDFARPYSLYNKAHIALGERRFGRAELFLQQMEDAIAGRGLSYHAVNGQALRARVALQTNQVELALDLLPAKLRVEVIPSMQGEYFATRAIALTLAGRTQEGRVAAKVAERTTTAVDVRGLVAVARALGSPSPESASELWRVTRELGTWDVLMLGLRASEALADTLSQQSEFRPALSELYCRSNDRGLARRASLRFRATKAPDEILTPREMEVLGLLAQGLRNQDIARALVISDSTIKVHVRHILEKLGVRTRAEAVARLMIG